MFVEAGDDVRRAGGRAQQEGSKVGVNLGRVHEEWGIIFIIVGVFLGEVEVAEAVELDQGGLEPPLADGAHEC